MRRRRGTRNGTRRRRLYAYRGWDLRVFRPEEGKEVLHLLPISSRTPPVWRGASWTHFSQSPYNHTVSFRFASGLYSFKHFFRALKYLAEIHDNDYRKNLIMGVVQLGGDVVEHQRGYRSQYARPVALTMLQFPYNSVAGNVERRRVLSQWCEDNDVLYVENVNELKRYHRWFRRGKLTKAYEPYPD